MYLPKEGFYSEFKYVEVATYVPKIKSVIRYQDKEKNPILLEYPDEVNKHFEKRGLVGAYTSIWRRKTSYIPDQPHPILAPLYFDLDDKDNFDTVCQESAQLVSLLTDTIPRNAIQVYFTGYKGFHVEVNPISFNASPSTSLPELYKFIGDQVAKEITLKTMDTQVRDSRRMWRLPNSQHQVTGLYKVLIDDQLEFTDIYQYAKEPHPIEESPVEFNMDAAQWFREFQYKFEDEQQDSIEDRIRRFEQFGCGRSVVLDNTNKVFDPTAIFETSCKFVKNMMEKAEEEHNLSHAERLALCSLLSYTDESLEYLLYILSQCTDFNEPKSQFHIKDWITRREKGTGGRPFTCRALKEQTISCGNCDKLERYQKYVQINDRLIATNEDADPSPVRLLYKRD